MKLYLNTRQIDTDSIVMEGVDTKDYPDFCDAYVAEAYFSDGGQLSDDELDQLTEEYPGFVNEWAFESQLP